MKPEYDPENPSKLDLMLQSVANTSVESSLSGMPCSVSLTHDQIGFIRESLEKRRIKPAGVNPMVDAWAEGVNEEIETILKVMGPCSTVRIS